MFWQYGLRPNDGSPAGCITSGVLCGIYAGCSVDPWGLIPFWAKDAETRCALHQFDVQDRRGQTSIPGGFPSRAALSGASCWLWKTQKRRVDPPARTRAGAARKFQSTIEPQRPRFRSGTQAAPARRPQPACAPASSRQKIPHELDRNRRGDGCRSDMC